MVELPPVLIAFVTQMA